MERAEDARRTGQAEARRHLRHGAGEGAETFVRAGQDDAVGTANGLRVVLSPYYHPESVEIGNGLPLGVECRAESMCQQLRGRAAAREWP